MGMEGCRWQSPEQPGLSWPARGWGSGDEDRDMTRSDNGVMSWTLWTAGGPLAVLRGGKGRVAQEQGVKDKVGEQEAPAGTGGAGGASAEARDSGAWASHTVYL